jgi:hypothetical protein
MAAASVLLIVTFLLEQPWAPGHRQERLVISPPPEETHSPVMDTQAFLEVREQNRLVPQKSLFTLYADCIQHHDCDNAAVRNFRTKMKL